MAHTYRASGKLRWATATLITLSVLAGAALTYRIWRASAFGILEAITSLTTGALIAGAVASGWMIHARKLSARANLAEWENARLRREELLDDDADRELWDSIPAKQIDEDTIAFGPNVIPINRWQYPEAG